MEAVKLIGTAVAMLIGLILTPVVAVACENATTDEGTVTWALQTGNQTNITPVQNITGLVEVIELIPYIYVFVIIGAGLLTMYHFYKS